MFNQISSITFSCQVASCSDGIGKLIFAHCIASFWINFAEGLAVKAPKEATSQVGLRCFQALPKACPFESRLSTSFLVMKRTCRSSQERGWRWLCFTTSAEMR